jgi:prepilin-type N-terminal cleavage/methylation domain-containing protein
MSARYTKYHILYTSAYTLIRTIRKNLISAYGYTLIEILVSLTIIGLLFSFGYVSFRDFSRRQAVIGTAKSIQADLRIAQADAISGQKPKPTDLIHCSAALDGYYFYIVSGTEYKIQISCGNTIDVKDVVLSNDTSISSPFPSPNPILFKVLGQGTNVGSSWTLNLTQIGTNNATTVSVTSGGEIQ